MRILAGWRWCGCNSARWEKAGKLAAFVTKTSNAVWTTTLYKFLSILRKRPKKWIFFLCRCSKSFSCMNEIFNELIINTFKIKIWVTFKRFKSEKDCHKWCWKVSNSKSLVLGTNDRWQRPLFISLEWIPVSYKRTRKAEKENPHSLFNMSGNSFQPSSSNNIPGFGQIFGGYFL